MCVLKLYTCTRTKLLYSERAPSEVRDIKKVVDCIIVAIFICRETSSGSQQLGGGVKTAEATLGILRIFVSSFIRRIMSLRSETE